MAVNRLMAMVGMVAVQQTALGLLSTSIIHQHYAGIFVASLLVNGAWWFNAGYRIDMHGTGWVGGTVYVLTAAASVTFGAWLGWR